MGKGLKLCHYNAMFFSEKHLTPALRICQVFGGNIDRNTPVYHSLHSPVQAKYLRFHPKTWSGHICTRAEVYGCQEGNYSRCIKHFVI